MHRLPLVLVLAGLAFGVAAEWAQYRLHDVALWGPDLAVGWTFLVCGWVVARRRGVGRAGGLFGATGVAWFAPNFAVLVPGQVGLLLGYCLFLHRGVLAQLLVTYPSARV